ncbi:large subunit GTPase 1 homolog, partial [Arapaima gigas]
GLVQQQRHGLGLLRLGHQHGVAAQHHRLVLHLVPVDPREHLGEPRVRHAVRDAVQQVQVARPARSLVRVHHPDALRAHGEAHPRAVATHLALLPDLAHGHVRAALPLGLDRGGVAQVQHRVRGVLRRDLHLLALGAEHAAHAVERALGAGPREGRERRVVEAHGVALLLGALVLLDQLELVLLPRQHLVGA